MRQVHRRRIMVLLLACLISHPAASHPHVWVTTKAELVFSSEGRITEVRHAWTFDKGFSAYTVQGRDTNKDGTFTPEELQEVAKDNMASLPEFEFYTQLKVNGTKQKFDPPRGYGMMFSNDEATLTFALPLKAAPPTSKILALEVYDPTFFVAFSMAEGSEALKLTGAPKGCAVTITRPKPLEVAKQQNLSEAFFQALTAASNFGSQVAHRAIVACP